MMSDSSVGLGNGYHAGADRGSPRNLESGPQQEQERQMASRSGDPLSLSDAQPDTFNRENIAVRSAFDSDGLAPGLPEMSDWIGSKDREEWLKALQVSIDVVHENIRTRTHECASQQHCFQSCIAIPV